MFQLLKINWPCWYKLYYDRGGVIIISIHKKAWLFICRLVCPDSPLCGELQKLLNLPPFPHPTTTSWGFTNCFQLTPSADKQWMQVLCRLPVHDGQPPYAIEKIYAVSASMLVLFQALSLFAGNTKNKEDQLIGIERWDAFPKQMGGWGLQVILSPALCDFLECRSSSLSNDEFEQSITENISTAMTSAYRHVFPHSRMHNLVASSVRCSFQKPKFLTFHSFGNDCKLYGSEHDSYSNPGAVMHGNNVDFPSNQLIFLAGLAELHSLYR